MKTALYGASGGGIEFEKTFRSHNIDVVSFFDTDTNKHGKKLNNIPIDSINNHTNYDFDYIVIASQSNYEEEIYNTIIKHGVEPEKIIPGSILRRGYDSCYFLPQHIKDVQICVSGLSYHRDAILPKMMDMCTYNYARSSQDLYYDFKIAQKIIENTSKWAIKLWFIGLCGYSLEYDLTQTINWSRVFYYKDEFGYHHLAEEKKKYYLNAYCYPEILELFGKNIFVELVRPEKPVSTSTPHFSPAVGLSLRRGAETPRTQKTLRPSASTS
jgi:hypothetical protein